MMDTLRTSKKTQIARTEVSAPTRWLLENAAQYIRGRRIVNFGEGKAFADTRELGILSGKEPFGYDPNSPMESHRVPPPEGVFDACVSNYVFNTLAPVARRIAFQDMLRYAPVGFVSVRKDKIKGKPAFDGVITSRGTFQKSYTDGSFRKDFIEYSRIRLLVATPGFLLYRVIRSDVDFPV